MAKIEIQKMSERPRIKIELTPADRIVELISWAVLLALWILTLTHYAKLPDIIPTHYNASGQVDGYGGKLMFLLIPLIATIFFVGITIANKYPHIFNYLTKITEENALRQYTIATRMMRFLKLMLVILFGYISFTTIRVADGVDEGLNTLLLPLLIALLFVVLGYYIVKSIRTK